MPNRTARRAKKKPPSRRYQLALTGELAGFQVTMSAMSGADIVAVRSGEMPETEVVKMVAACMVEHDFDIDDPLKLEYWILVDILTAWGAAMEDSASPPVSGGR